MCLSLQCCHVRERSEPLFVLRTNDEELQSLHGLHTQHLLSCRVIQRERHGGGGGGGGVVYSISLGGGGGGGGAKVESGCSPGTHWRGLGSTDTPPADMGDPEIPSGKLNQSTTAIHL